MCVGGWVGGGGSGERAEGVGAGGGGKTGCEKKEGEPHRLVLGGEHTSSFCFPMSSCTG